MKCRKQQALRVLAADLFCGACSIGSHICATQETAACRVTRLLGVGLVPGPSGRRAWPVSKTNRDRQTPRISEEYGPVSPLIRGRPGRGARPPPGPLAPSPTWVLAPVPAASPSPCPLPFSLEPQTRAVRSNHDTCPPCLQRPSGCPRDCQFRLPPGHPLPEPGGRCVKQRKRQVTRWVCCDMHYVLSA